MTKLNVLTYSGGILFFLDITPKINTPATLKYLEICQQCFGDISMLGVRRGEFRNPGSVKKIRDPGMHLTSGGGISDKSDGIRDTSI